MSAIIVHLTDFPALLAALAVDLLDGLNLTVQYALSGLRLLCLALAFLLLVPVLLAASLMAVVFSVTFGASARLGFREKATGTREAWAELFRAG